MPMDLLIPKPKLIVPKLPSYVKLDMAFGVGAGTTLFDKSRYRSHGAITGATWATGNHGYCLKFSVSDTTYVLITPTPTQLNFTSEPFSVIARFKTTRVVGQNQAIFSTGDYHASGYAFFVLGSGSIYLRTEQVGAAQDTIASAAFPSATWATIGVSRSGATATIYLNGVDVTTTHATHINPVSSAVNMYIGRLYNTSTYPNNGQLEFLRIIGGIALSTSEHLAWHNALA